MLITSKGKATTTKELIDASIGTAHRRSRIWPQRCPAAYSVHRWRIPLPSTPGAYPPSCCSYCTWQADCGFPARGSGCLKERRSGKRIPTKLALQRAWLMTSRTFFAAIVILRPRLDREYARDDLSCWCSSCGASVWSSLSDGTGVTFAVGTKKL
jgi:hypothetical protein